MANGLIRGTLTETADAREVKKNERIVKVVQRSIDNRRSDLERMLEEAQDTKDGLIIPDSLSKLDAQKATFDIQSYCEASFKLAKIQDNMSALDAAELELLGTPDAPPVAA